MIYLVHHGDAVGPDVDSTRPLSDRGRAAVLAVAHEAARRGVKPEAIWHSGKRRAKQTAEIFWKECQPFAPLTAERGLQPADPPEWMRERLSGERRELMLVGHMPHLARLRQLLAGDDVVAFPLHGMVALEPHDRAWKEAWQITSP